MVIEKLLVGLTLLMTKLPLASILILFGTLSSAISRASLNLSSVAKSEPFPLAARRADRSICPPEAILPRTVAMAVTSCVESPPKRSDALSCGLSKQALKKSIFAINIKCIKKYFMMVILLITYFTKIRRFI